MSILSVSDVQRIADIPDPVIRNLNITVGYSELSGGMRRVTGGNPSWCTYAVWASKQAGQSIRCEDLVRNFEYYFHTSPELNAFLNRLPEFIKDVENLPALKALKDSIFDAVDPLAVFERSALAVAEGNKKVFFEIGSWFARFLASFPSDQDFTPENVNAFCSKLKPGDPPDGQQCLRDAFASYALSCSAKDPKSKMELIHYANLLIGYHEQTRLQPQILQALDAEFDDPALIRRKIFKLFMPGLWLKTRFFLSKSFNVKFPLDGLLDDIVASLEALVRKVITQFLMSLAVPGTPMIRLGSDLNVNFPPLLQHLVNKNLIALLAKIDPTTDSLKDSGVIDWGDLNDRVHFIADFFRCFFAYTLLLNAPYSDQQTITIKAGRLPQGDL